MHPAAAEPLPDTLNFYCTTDEAIIYLVGLEQQVSLPTNVLDIDPYRYRPENLPDAFWYLVQTHLRDGTESCWRPLGDPSRVFFNAPISGWMTILQFSEGIDPLPDKTIWLMQEFRITQDGSMPTVNSKDARALCRVFQHYPVHEMLSRVDDIHFPSENKKSSAPCLLLDADSRTERGSTSAHQENDNSAAHLVAADSPLNDPAEDWQENDCIAGGDYLELLDLSLPVSPSSSENSSCLTMSSDERFDSLALLQDLEVEQEDDPLVRPENVGARTAGSGALIINEQRNFPLEAIRGTADGPYLNRPSRDENHSRATAASTSGQTSDPEGSKKAVDRMKKLKKKYLCFMPF